MIAEVKIDLIGFVKNKFSVCFFLLFNVCFYIHVYYGLLIPMTKCKTIVIGTGYLHII